MSKEEFIKVLADEYGIEPNEDGKYDLNDYDWTSGCSFGYGRGVWLTLANIVNAFEERGYFDEDEDY